MPACLSCRGSSGQITGHQPAEAAVPKAEIGRLYDRIAPFYDIWGRLTESRAAERAVDLAGIRDGQHILEVAVGTGLTFQKIVRRNPRGRNIGVDLSRGMLAKARRRLSRIPHASFSLVQGDAAALDLESGTIDRLINSYMFDLIAFREMAGVLTEFHRVLKPGGKLVLVNMTVGRTAGSRIYDRLYRRFPRLLGGCRGVDLGPLLGQNRFRVQTREYVQQCLFPSEVIVAYPL
jgi:demethylmenaquinone methyltransferase / 2-methoxy-6-polyprenyl-1,4-benzoquinol methylase